MTRECFMQFEVSATDGKARRGEMTFPRGKVQTPAFMPVGTYGTVKGMLPKDIVEIQEKYHSFHGGKHDARGQTQQLVIRLLEVTHGQ